VNPSIQATLLQRATLLYCLRERLPASVKNKNAGS
jgi:hypothetical protein